MASTRLPRKMTLADSRWVSSRSMLDSPPIAPAAEDEPIRSSIASSMNESYEDSSPEEVVPRSQRTMVIQQVLSALTLKNSEEVKPPSKASSQGLSTEIATVCPPQVLTAAPRSPRKCLNEEALSAHCLYKTSKASNRKFRSRELSRSTSVADLENPVASTLLRRNILADSRWASSRSLLDSSPTEVAFLAPRPQQKILARLIRSAVALNTPGANLPSAASSQPARPVADMHTMATLPRVQFRVRCRVVPRAATTPRVQLHKRCELAPASTPRAKLRVCYRLTPLPASTLPVPSPGVKLLVRCRLAPAATTLPAPPPTTVCRKSLTAARWDSSRSLSDCPPKSLQRSPRVSYSLPDARVCATKASAIAA